VQQVASRFGLADRGGQEVVSHGQAHLQPDIWALRHLSVAR
jgi:hypothetical protein